MSDTVIVVLSAPAKVGGKWKKPGETVAVSPDLLDQLSIEGTPRGAQDTVGSMIEDAVVARLEAETAPLVEALAAAHAAAVNAEEQRDTAVAEADDLRLQVAVARDQIAKLQGQQDAPSEPVPVEQDTEAAQITSKKTGSGTTKG